MLPAYVIGMVLAGTVGKDHILVRRLRTLTFGLLTPFYFIRAGSFVSIPALIAAPFAFIFLLGRQGGDEDRGRLSGDEGLQGAEAGSDLYDPADVDGPDLRHHLVVVRPVAHIIDQGQYSALVAAVIASAVIPTVIANAFYLPRHLIPKPEPEPAVEPIKGGRLAAAPAATHAADQAV